MNPFVKATLAAATVGIVVAIASEAIAASSPEPIAYFLFEEKEEVTFFYIEREDCPEGGHVAVHAQLKTKVLTPGCYFDRKDHFFVKFSDGDVSRIPKNSIKLLAPSVES
jgi:hypothetical protein